IKGIETHRARAHDQGTTWRGVPITTVPRTLIDIAHKMPVKQLTRAVHEADVRHGVTRASFRTRLPKPLRAILEGDIPITLSELENRFLELLASEGLPTPHTNRPRGTKRVDCHWAARGLIVELDSYRFHRTRHA